jgi:hypothetical protein
MLDRLPTLPRLLVLTTSLTTLIATSLAKPTQASSPCLMINAQGRRIDLSHLCAKPISLEASQPKSQELSQGQVGRALGLPSALTPFVPTTRLVLTPNQTLGRRQRSNHGVIFLEAVTNQPAYSILQGFIGNASPNPARNLGITYEVINPKGTAIARGTQLVEPHTLKPGQSTNFYLTWQAIENVLPSPLSKDIKTLQFRVTGVTWTNPQGQAQQTSPDSYQQAIGTSHCDYAWEQDYRCLSRAGKL